MVGVGAAEMVHVVNKAMPPKAPMPQLMWNSPANLDRVQIHINDDRATPVDDCRTADDIS
jgi:hypothetical protein